MAIHRKPDGTTHGGQEPPDELQDRPEQNAAYDEVVDGFTAPMPEDRVPAPDNDEAPPEDVDDRAAREAAAEVRRRERSAR
jgi:hypothetical protein